MKMSLSQADLAIYVARQVSYLFPDETITGNSLGIYVEYALQRAEFCFAHIKKKYFFDGEHACFNHLHTDQYAMFLYFLGNTIYRMGGNFSLAGKVYALNKTLHAVDAFYEVELPEIFAFQHPLGTVLGRGNYSNYFFVYQRCSIGANLDGVYPTLGEGVVMFGGSAVIGNCIVGNNCWLSAGAVIMDADIPPNSVVFGHSPNIVIRTTGKDVVKDMFRVT